MQKRTRIPVFLLLAILVIGVLGYMLIESLDFYDALYMTIITVSTVGFREVAPLSNGGKIFTVALIVSSLGIVAYSFSVLTSRIVEGEFRHYIRGQINKSGLKKMKDHVIVCGLGRNGREAIHELQAHGLSFVVIDNNPDIIRGNLENNILVIEGDATEDQILDQAGVRQARALIASLPNDADNLFVAVTARSLNPGLSIISRASNETTARKLKVAGVDRVVLPEKVGGEHMASLVIHPDLIQFLDHISIHGIDETNLVEITCNNIGKEYRDKTIREMEIRIRTGANIIGYKDVEGHFVINPVPETRLVQGSKLFVLGTPAQISKMKALLSS